MPKATRRPEGITVRHSRSCPSVEGAKCNCRPAYQANVWSARERKRIRKSFPTLAAAKAWRSDAVGALCRGTMRAPSPTTLREAGEAWLAGARDGSIRTRSGDVYKPSAIRGYDDALRLHLLPALGARKLTEITTADVQDIADRLLAVGRSPSTIANALMPLRAIYRRAMQRGDVVINPTANLSLPAVRGKRERIAPPEEAGKLLAALPERDRALWATAFYGGLRRGELMALRFEDLDLAGGVIRIERSYDPKAKVMTDPKSRAGFRNVPIPAVLRDYLVEHRMTSTWADGLVFGRSVDTPFSDSSVNDRAQRTWQRVDLAPIGLHEARHTYASLMIAAGVNAKSLSEYMGHSSITITLDRYGHLFPGAQNESASLLDAFLARADTAARLAAVEGTFLRSQDGGAA